MEAESSADVVPLHSSDKSRSESRHARGRDELPFAIGTVLGGRFRLEDVIAVGGTSCLYLGVDELAATSEVTDSYLALKVPCGHSDDHLYNNLIFREVAIGRLVCDRRVVDVFDLHQENGVAFITQELIRGESLSTRLARNGQQGLEPRTYLAIGRELVGALAALHRKGLVHSDIKPSNVLLSRDGQLRLIDLGTARPFRRMPRIGEPPFQGFSPAYASPQVLRDEAADPRDDVYSLACLMYEQISGQHPFDRLDARRAEAEAHKPRRPRGLPFLQWLILRQALAFNADKRPRSVTRFWQRFTRARYAGPGIATLAAGILVAFAALAPASQAQSAEPDGSQHGVVSTTDEEANRVG